MGLCCSSSRHKSQRENHIAAALSCTHSTVDESLSMPTPSIDIPKTTVVDRLMQEAKCISINIEQIRNKLSSMGLSKCTYDDHDDVEDPVLIWIDNIENECDYLHAEMKMAAQECGDRMLAFTNRTECISEIQATNSETLILVVFNSWAADVLPAIHHLVKVHSVFVILEPGEIIHDILSSQDTYFKILKIEANCAHFKLKLRQQLHFTRQQVKRLHFYDYRQRNTRDLTYEGASHMWFQLVIDVLKKMTDSTEALEDMLRKCFDHYATNPPVRKAIEQFRVDMKKKVENNDDDTSMYKAIVWYSRATFVHRLVNKALRTEDIDQLYTMRFIIAQISSQLALLREEQFHHRPDDLTLFHGCHLKLRECEHLKNSIGNLISTNFFLSTSLDDDTAAEYGQVIKSGKHEKQSVMFKITVDTNIRSIVFASIAHLSKIPSDNEVLFDVGTIFLIKNVTQDSETQKWLVELVGSECDLSLKDEYIQMNRLERVTSNVMLLFGKLLIDMAHFSKANEYYITLLKDEQTQSDLSLCASIFYYIGVSLSSTGDFLRAFHCYMYAFAIQKNMTKPLIIVDFARTVNSLGDLFSSQRQFQEAFECYHHTRHLLEIHTKIDFENHSEIIHPLIASALMNIGTVYRQQEEYGLSLAYHLRSLDMFKKIYLFPHPDVVRAWSNVAITLDDIGQHQLALQCLETAFQLTTEMFPPNHPLSAYIYSNLGSVYLSMGNISSALDKYLEALYIFKLVFPPFHSDIATTLMNIGSVYETSSQLQKALEYYQNAWEIRRLILPLTSVTLRFQESIDESYSSNRSTVRPPIFNRSRSFNEAAKLLPSGPPINADKSLSVAHVFLAESFLKIGNIYAQDKQWALAHHYCSQAMLIYEQIPDNISTITEAKVLCSNIIQNSKGLLHIDLKPVFL